jgi:hypothetical protein
MTEILIFVAVIALSLSVVAYLLLRGADQMLSSATHLPSVHTAAPEPPAPTLVSALQPSQTRIRLVSNSGKHLEDVSVTRRRVSLQQRVGKAQELCNFVASHKEDDVWVYRQVETERE